LEAEDNFLKSTTQLFDQQIATTNLAMLGGSPDPSRDVAHVNEVQVAVEERLDAAIAEITDHA